MKLASQIGVLELTDADCPTSPGKKHGTCLDETLEVAPTDASYFHCTFPTSTKTLKASCY